MKVLLFGGNGFLGKALEATLKADGIECLTVSRNAANSDFSIDISRSEDFKTLPDHFFDTVINCATILPGGHYLDADYLESIYKTNVLGTQNICNWINTQNTVKKIINCSTLSVIAKPWKIDLTEDEPTYPTGNHVLYSSSKLTQELIFSTFAAASKIPLTQIRFSALYGPTMKWGGVICNLIDQAKNKNTIELTNASKVNADFLYVEDAAKIITAAVKSDYEGILNGASGVETSILQLAEIIAENFQSVEIINTEAENFIEDRAKINIQSLNKIVGLEGFTDLRTGIRQMLAK